MRKIIEYYPLFASGAILAGFFTLYTLVGDENLRNPVLVATYGMLAVGVIALAVGHLVLVYRERNGTAPFWLVSISYAFATLGFALCALFVVAVARLLTERDYVWEEQLVYGSIGAAAVALNFAAFAFAIGMRKRVMRKHVWATPWHAAAAAWRRFREKRRP